MEFKLIKKTNIKEIAVDNINLEIDTIVLNSNMWSNGFEEILYEYLEIFKNEFNKFNKLESMLKGIEELVQGIYYEVSEYFVEELIEHEILEYDVEAFIEELNYDFSKLILLINNIYLNLSQIEQKKEYEIARRNLKKELNRSYGDGAIIGNTFRGITTAIGNTMTSSDANAAKENTLKESKELILNIIEDMIVSCYNFFIEILNSNSNLKLLNYTEYKKLEKQNKTILLNSNKSEGDYNKKWRIFSKAFSNIPFSDEIWVYFYENFSENEDVFFKVINKLGDEFSIKKEELINKFINEKFEDIIRNKKKILVKKLIQNIKGFNWRSKLEKFIVSLKNDKIEINEILEMFKLFDLDEPKKENSSEEFWDFYIEVKEEFLYNNNIEFKEIIDRIEFIEEHIDVARKYEQEPAEKEIKEIFSGIIGMGIFFIIINYGIKWIFKVEWYKGIFIVWVIFSIIGAIAPNEEKKKQKEIYEKLTFNGFRKIKEIEIEYKNLKEKLLKFIN